MRSVSKASVAFLALVLTLALPVAFGKVFQDEPSPEPDPTANAIETLMATVQDHSAPEQDRSRALVELSRQTAHEKTRDFLSRFIAEGIDFRKPGARSMESRRVYRNAVRVLLRQGEPWARRAIEEAILIDPPGGHYILQVLRESTVENAGWIASIAARSSEASKRHILENIHRWPEFDPRRRRR